jgi:hypothetical protein
MFENKIYLPYLLILFVLLIILYFNFDRLVMSTFSKDGLDFGSTFSKDGLDFGSTFSKGGKEGFISITWSPITIKNFLNYEQTRNPNLVFDVDLIQQQASEDEVKILMKTGKWPWSDETKKLYMDAVKINTMIKTSPKAAMEQAQAIYNETIIKEMIAWSSPEGQFLLRGAYSINQPNNQTQTQNNGSGSFGINSGLVTKSNDLIRCGIDSNNKVYLEKIENMGNNGITGVHKKKTTKVDYKKLPELVSGFRFIKSPCDPCSALDGPPKYNCPFSLTSKDPSPIWVSLWGLKGSNIESHKKHDKLSFPLLSELKSELNTLLPEVGVKVKSQTNETLKNYKKNKIKNI